MPWKPEEKDAVVKALAVVCEITNTQMSDAAITFMLDHLGQHPAPRVLTALKLCVTTCRGRLTIADIEECITDAVEEERNLLAEANTKRLFAQWDAEREHIKQLRASGFNPPTWEEIMKANALAKKTGAP